jgi:hypothetical protein
MGFGGALQGMKVLGEAKRIVVGAVKKSLSEEVKRNEYGSKRDGRRGDGFVSV